MRKSALPAIAVIAPFATMAAFPAHATTLSAKDILGQFNAIIFGDFSTSADVEGRTAVGGNLTGGATFDMKPGNISASAFAGLTVYGDATASKNYNIANGGGVTIAGSNNASFTLNGGGVVFIGSANSGNLNTSNGSGSVTIGGANSGTLQINSSGSVYVGQGNSGGITANSSTSVAVKGGNSGNVTLNNGGTLSLVGSNTGVVTLNGGTFTYSANKGSANLNGGATADHVGGLTLTPPANPLPSFADTFQTPLTSLSAQLDALTANSVLSASGNAITLDARPDANGTAVFDIRSTDLKQNATVTLNLNGAESVIINVTVDGCVSSTCVFSLPDSLNFANPTSYAEHVLWNFINATGLTFPTEIGGSILAPLATVSNGAPIDGTLVAAGYSGNGELHSYPYSGDLPIATGTPVNEVPVPEPTSLALVASGLAGLMMRRRRIGSSGTSGRPGRA